MPATWYGGVPWAPTTLTRAIEMGVADELSEIALRYRSGRGGVSSWPNPGPRGGTRVKSAGGPTVTLSDLRVVVGFAAAPVEDVEAPPRPAPVRRGQPRGKSRGSAHGPKSYEELLEMLRGEGYEVSAPGGSGHPKVYNRAGNQVAVLNSTPSDHRGLHNDVAALRRVLGVRLRKPGR